ncbi:MAG: putative metal-binding motif-containing protein [Planctomycetes bacterium]|nr:putative metal-binding motif-containing protein [Planctomycetota bacterium]
MTRLHLPAVLALACAAVIPPGGGSGAQCERLFLRGDSNLDGGLDLSDGIRTLLFLFAGEAAPGCLDAADVNDSGNVDISDPVYGFSYLFAGGPAPPLPGSRLCGDDPTLDPLDCAESPSCPEDCGCTDGEVRPCGTSDLGDCELGMQVCRRGQWGPCEGNREPGTERCDGLDNDCDGDADEGFERIGEPCDGPDADLCATGTYACAQDGLGVTCSGESGPGSEEVCDGADNDCNGTVDDGFDLDSDGWRTCDGDCDDSRASVNPGRTFDPIDGRDNDCDGATDEGPITTSYARDIQPIWDARCNNTFCHDSVIPTGGLDLTAEVSYRNLVNRVSLEAPRLDRVEPLNPDRSYLWHKLNGTQGTVGGTGGSMPLSSPLLPAATREKIVTWILEGAPR